MSRKLKLVYYGRVLSKKNSKQIVRKRSGVPVLVSNPAAKANETDMVEQFVKQANLAAPIRRCTVSIIIYEPDFQRRDLDNQATSILDALTGAKVIADDSFKCVRKISTSFAGIDRESPRALVTIVEEQDNG